MSQDHVATRTPPLTEPLRHARTEQHRIEHSVSLSQMDEGIQQVRRMSLKFDQPVFKLDWLHPTPNPTGYFIFVIINASSPVNRIKQRRRKMGILMLAGIHFQ